MGSGVQSGSELQNSSLATRLAQPADAAQWDAFVESHPEGRFCQMWGFRSALEDAYGYRCLSYQILREDQPAGVFPSIVVRRGKGRLISQPFQEYGGPLVRGLAEQDYDPLARLLVRLAQEQGCASVEIRGGVSCEKLAASQWCAPHPLHSIAILPLDNPDVLWKRRLNQEARKAVTRARAAGFTVEVRRGPRCVEDPFFSLYLLSMKRLGVPPHSARFLQGLAAGLGERAVATWVWKQSQVAAILLGFITGPRLQIYITASHPDHWSLRPNDLAHWELIAWAAAQGLRTFDLGSARYQGQVHFKKKWGADFSPYAFYLLGPPQSRDLQKIQTVQSSSPEMSAAAAVWRRLVPLPLTRLLGPLLRKYLTK